MSLGVDGARPVRPASRARPGRAALLRSPGPRLAGLALLALVFVALFLATDLPGKWEYALGLRWRTVAGMIVAAAAIGAATVLFQTITANRILTPGIMGFDAVFMAIQVLTVFAVGPALLVSAPPGASWAVELVLTGGAVVLLYWWLFLRRRLDLHVIVLAGLILGTVFRSVTAFLQRLLDPDTFAIIQNLAFASFTSVDRELLAPTAVLVAIALASLWPIRHSLDVLSLGEATAVTLGVEHRRVVMHVVLAIAAMVAASTALVGPVTFFGLIVANLAYGAVGHRHLRSVPAAIAIGVIALVGGQLILDRLLGFATELPVVIEFVGGVFFIILVLTGRAR
ncbi:iron chelate uptake ABC transporter family permease subunit [Microbacterium sp. BWT-B31]|uniref:iron chelate uptake ABC transporter family permease subunit n=1 Tax=Microbacterium sp. BWT-B31 TaxID=3232072 RepID=UPI003526CF92